MPRVLVMTIGVGGANPASLVEGLSIPIDRLNPDKVVFVHSHTSKQIAERLAEKSKDFGVKSIEFFEIKDVNEVDKIFEEVINLFRDLIISGTRVRDITLDFTSGTKAMSAAAVLAASVFPIRTLSYVAGDRKDGIVQQGFETLYTLEPKRTMSYNLYQMATNHFSQLRYSSAKECLSKIPRGNNFFEKFNSARNTLETLIKGYEAWDLFDHKTALETLKTPGKAPEGFSLEPFSPQSKLGALAQINNKKQGGIPKHLVIDLYANAQRRVFEGKYDDAVARLYRTTEMAEQWILLTKYKILTSSLLESQVPENTKFKYDWKFNGKGKDRTATVGLEKGYALLRDLGDPLGDLLPEKGEFRNLLAKRNQSILAHGVNPIVRDDCTNLSAHVKNLLEKVFEDEFSQIYESLQFGWIKENA